jgi:type IV pilus assembly protein PilA
MISKLNAGMSARNEEGFTLIELMIVIAIIGILAAIAIPQFSAYRKRAFNAAAETDVRNISTAQEAYYVDHQSYGALADVETPKYGYVRSTGVTPSVAGSGTSSYSISASHSQGDKTYTVQGPGGKIGS